MSISSILNLSCRTEAPSISPRPPQSRVPPGPRTSAPSGRWGCWATRTGWPTPTSTRRARSRRAQRGRQMSVAGRARELLLEGTSMGGARPKAVVENGRALWVAKLGRDEDRCRPVPAEPRRSGIHLRSRNRDGQGVMARGQARQRRERGGLRRNPARDPVRRTLLPRVSYGCAVARP